MSDESKKQSTIQSFTASDEETHTRVNPRKAQMLAFLDMYKKHIFFVYLFVGIVLFYLLISKPVLRDPYLIDIFNR
ncbi:MAG: hypothetical protein KDK51_10065 [Deltaproteobacteria bacterium]|nr:hypothetical protein [Deltaproteobacteria bacterium]